MQNRKENETEKKERLGGAGIVYKAQSLSRDSRDGELRAWEYPCAEDLGKATSDDDRVRPARRQRSCNIYCARRRVKARSASALVG